MTDRADVPSVLVVDDDPMVLRVLVRVLQHWGRVELTALTDSRAAMEQLASGTVDLLISDLRMPGYSGLSLLDAGREHRPDLPVIIVTGHATQQIEREIQQRNASLLRKPWAREALLAAVEHALQR